MFVDDRDACLATWMASTSIILYYDADKSAPLVKSMNLKGLPAITSGANFEEPGV